jgi:hypothetical protein
MPKTGFRLPSYPEAQIGSLGASGFNDLEDRKSRGTPPRDKASRKSIKEALEYLDQNLPGLRRGTPRHEYLIDRVRSSGRPLRTAKAICRDYIGSGRPNADHRAAELDASDVQELWVKVFRRQGRMILPEQERIFRDLDRLAFRGGLTRADLDRADKLLRMFKVPGTLDRGWAKAELLTDMELST